MYRKFKSKEGLRFILVPMKNTKVVTVMVLVACGSRYEREELNGISHFIEHMVFKGTKKYPQSLAIAKTLDGVGADYNAYTSKETTGFYVRLPSKHLEIALDVLSDFVKNPLFPEEEIAKEKKVILEEIKMRKDQPMVLADDLLERVLYRNSALGRDIAGREESVSKITRKKLVHFVKKFYGPKSIVVVVAGDINKSYRQKIIDYFRLRRKKERKEFSQARILLTPKVGIIKRKIEQTHLRLGFYGYSYYHRDYYPFLEMAGILGGSMSS